MVVGSEFAFDVSATFDGEAYPAADIKQVIELALRRHRSDCQVLAGELVEMDTMSIPPFPLISRRRWKLAPQLEAVVVPYVVAISTLRWF